MKSLQALLCVLCLPLMAVAQVLPRPPAPKLEIVIDMHLHALRADAFGPPGQPNPATGKPSAATDAALREVTLSALSQYNIVLAVASGPLPVVEQWKAAAPGKIIPALLMDEAGNLPDLAGLRAAFRERRLEVLGEIGAQYMGLSLSSPELEPYLALAEELDVPVGIHTGFGPPGATYNCCPKFRAGLGNPLLLEEALVRHPKLRVYMMHAGYPFLEEAIAVLHAHPQLYADLAVIDWVLPRQEFHDYLRRLMQHTECGMPKRLLFGSDQMIWPEAIGVAVENIESADFLTAEQKRDIFYNNAARFLRLSSEAPGK